MKRWECPECSYAKNDDDWYKCAICGADAPPVASRSRPRHSMNFSRDPSPRASRVSRDLEQGYSKRDRPIREVEKKSCNYCLWTCAIIGTLAILLVGGGLLWWVIDPVSFPLTRNSSAKTGSGPTGSGPSSGPSTDNDIKKPKKISLGKLCHALKSTSDGFSAQYDNTESSYEPLQDPKVTKIPRPTGDGVNNLDPLKRLEFKVKSSSRPRKIWMSVNGQQHYYDIDDNIKNKRISCKKTSSEGGVHTFAIQEVDDLAYVDEVQATPSRVALLITVSYPGGTDPLPGTEDDGRRMKNFLMKKGFNVTWMQDFSKQPGDPLYCSKANIERTLIKFVKERKKNDVLWLQYSGHGTQITGGTNTEEADNTDEAIVPAGWDGRSAAGLISDDWFNKHVVHAIPEFVETNIMFDCCHSGTMMDLPYYFDDTQGKFIRNPKAEKVGKNKRILYLSGCGDAETSKELTWKYNDGSIKKRGGALTLGFLEAVQKDGDGDKISLKKLITFLVSKVKKRDQKPKLSCSVAVKPETQFAQMFDGKPGTGFRVAQSAATA